MDKDYVEELRKMYEVSYREIESSAVVVTEMGEVDYSTNSTIQKYIGDGYKLIDSNRFGEGLEPCGEFLVFVKKQYKV